MFSVIWERIKANQGQAFHQIRGAAFAYAVTDEHVYPNRTNQRIPKSHFEEAFAFVPLPNTAPVQHLRGPSYIYAILMDERIR